MADGGGGEIDPTVERLRLCVEEGKEIRTDEDGFWLGDDFLLPKDTICECPWVVKDMEAQEMVLERARLATLVLLVQSPAKNTWSQYMQASKRARIPALSLWSFKSAQRFFSLGASASPSPRRSNRPAGAGAARPAWSSSCRTGISPASASPAEWHARKAGAGKRGGGGEGGQGAAGFGSGRRRLFVGDEYSGESGGGGGDDGGEGYKGEAAGGAGKGEIGVGGGGCDAGGDGVRVDARGMGDLTGGGDGSHQGQQHQKLTAVLTAVPTLGTVVESPSRSSLSSSSSRSTLEPPPPPPPACDAACDAAAPPASRVVTTEAAEAAASATGNAEPSRVGADSSSKDNAAAFEASPSPSSPPSPPTHRESTEDKMTDAEKSAGEKTIAGPPADAEAAFEGDTAPTAAAAAAVAKDGGNENDVGGGAETALSWIEDDDEAWEKKAAGSASAASSKKVSSIGVEMVEIVGGSGLEADGLLAVAGRGKATARATESALLRDSRGRGRKMVVGRVGLQKDELVVAKQGATRLGSLVQTKTGHVGTVRFCGFTEFATGLWLGLELDEPEGKNDGSNQLTRYFTCPEQHGLFVRPASVVLLSPAPSPAAAPSGEAETAAAAGAACCSPDAGTGGEKGGDWTEEIGEFVEEGAGVAEGDGDLTEQDESCAEREGSFAERDGSFAERGASFAEAGGDGENRGEGIGGGGGGCEDGGPDESATTTPYHDQMSPPLPRPLLATGGRSPLAEVTEDRRHSVNSNPPDHPLSRHGSPTAAARKKEFQKGEDTQEDQEEVEGDGGGGGKLDSVGPLRPLTPPKIRRYATVTPSTTPTSPFRGRPASTIPSPTSSSFAEKLAAAESESDAVAVVVAATAAVAASGRGSQKVAAAAATYAAAAAAAAAATSTSKSLSSVPCSGTGGDSSSSNRDPPALNGGEGGSGMEGGVTTSEDGAGAPHHMGSPGAVLLEETAAGVEQAETGHVPDGDGGGGECGGAVRPGGVMRSRSSLLYSPTGMGGESPPSVSAKIGPVLPRKKTKMSAGVVTSEPVLGAADVASMKRGAVAAAVSAMEARLATCTTPTKDGDGDGAADGATPLSRMMNSSIAPGLASDGNGLLGDAVAAAGPADEPSAASGLVSEPLGAPAGDAEVAAVAGGRGDAGDREASGVAQGVVEEGGNARDGVSEEGQETSEDAHQAAGEDEEYVEDGERISDDGRDSFGGEGAAGGYDYHAGAGGYDEGDAEDDRDEEEGAWSETEYVDDSRMPAIPEGVDGDEDASEEEGEEGGEEPTQEDEEEGVAVLEEEEEVVVVEDERGEEEEEFVVVEAGVGEDGGSRGDGRGGSSGGVIAPLEAQDATNTIPSPLDPPPNAGTVAKGASVTNDHGHDQEPAQAQEAPAPLSEDEPPSEADNAPDTQAAALDADDGPEGAGDDGDGELIDLPQAPVVPSENGQLARTEGVAADTTRAVATAVDAGSGAAAGLGVHDDCDGVLVEVRDVLVALLEDEAVDETDEVADARGVPSESGARAAADVSGERAEGAAREGPTAEFEEADHDSAETKRERETRQGEEVAEGGERGGIAGMAVERVAEDEEEEQKEHGGPRGAGRAEVGGAVAAFEIEAAPGPGDGREGRVGGVEGAGGALAGCGRRLAVCCFGVTASLAAAMAITAGVATVAGAPPSSLGSLDGAFEAFGRAAAAAADAVKPERGVGARSLAGVEKDGPRDLRMKAGGTGGGGGGGGGASRRAAAKVVAPMSISSSPAAVSAREGRGGGGGGKEARGADPKAFAQDKVVNLEAAFVGAGGDDGGRAGHAAAETTTGKALLGERGSGTKTAVGVASPAVTKRSVLEAARARVGEVLEQRPYVEGGAGAVELASMSKATGGDGAEVAEVSPKLSEDDEVVRDWAGPSAAETTEGGDAALSEATGDADLIDFPEEAEAEASEGDDDAQADADLIDFSGEADEAEGDGGDEDEAASARAVLIDFSEPAGTPEGEGAAPATKVLSDTAPDETATDEADPASPVSVPGVVVEEGPAAVGGAVDDKKSAATAVVDLEHPVSPWGPLALVADKVDEGVCPMPASRDSPWARKPSKPQPRCSKKNAAPWRRNPDPVSRPPALAGGEAAEEEETWLELVEVAEGGDGDGEVEGTEDVDRDTGDDAGQGEETVEMGRLAGEEKPPAPQVLAGSIESKDQLDELPAFLRPGGGMAQVAFLTGCRAAKMAPGSSKKCKSMPLLLGYTGKNVIELVEPGVGGKVLWRSRKSLVKVAKQSVGSRISSWFRGKKSPEEVAAPPQAIAGLYLRETHNRRLALVIKNKEGGGDAVGSAQEDGGHADSNGDDGGEGENESSGGGGEGGGSRSAVARAQGPDRVEFGVLLEGDSVSGMEKASAFASKKAQEMGGSAGRAGKDGDGEAEIEMRETQPASAPPPHDEDESEEKFAAMLIPGGRLCVFGTRGGVRCMSHGVHRWVTHVSGEGSTPQG